MIANALKNASVFGSTYVSEALFSKMVRIKNQYRNRLTDDHLKQFLRTVHSTNTSRFDKLIKSQNQGQVCIKLICVFFLVICGLLTLCFSVFLISIRCLQAAPYKTWISNLPLAPKKIDNYWFGVIRYLVMAPSF